MPKRGPNGAWYGKPDHSQERRFLSGKREKEEELLTAGRVFLEFVRGFDFPKSDRVFDEAFGK